MSEGLSLFGLLTALVLPWLAGGLAVRLLMGEAVDWSRALGYGFFAGQLIIIALLLGWDATGLSLAFGPLALLLVLLTVVLAWPVMRWRWSPLSIPDWPTIVWLSCAVLLGLVLGRFGLMAQELATRPLFAWDAWMNWVPRAVVWFHHQELTAFVLPPEWLAAPPATEVYSLGNWRASGYPPGVPLITLWMMLGAGTSDHTLLFLPWLFAPAAFSLALWGHLRERRAGPVLAMLAVYLFISPPLVAIHTMLVGYADLWLAFYFSLGVMAVDAFRHRRRVAYAVLALMMAAGCALMKTPGLVFGALVAVLAALVALRLPRTWWWRLTVTGLAGTAGLLVLGLLPGVGGGQASLPLPFFLPELRLQPQPLLPILVEQLFVFANWHLLWLVLALAGVAALLVRGRKALEAPAVTGLVVAAGLLVFAFGMTHYFRQAENLVTLNRALLYLVPLAAYVIGSWLATVQRAADAAE